MQAYLKRILCYALSLALLCVTLPAQAQQFSFIRDAEIESILSEYAGPIFLAADLAPEHVSVYIINDPNLNAFVAGGQKLFLNTGLLMKSDDPLLVIGVIAHEVGHISGGHLIRKQEEFENVGIGAALSYVLGAASIAVGAPAAGQAIISGGQHAAQRTALKYSRTHEQAADQAALELLTAMGYSASGLLELLETLFNKETLEFGELDPYALTHPLSQERISHVRNYVEQSSLKDKKAPEYLQQRHLRMVAKLKGFLNPPERTLQETEGDTTLAGRYRRAIAHYRNQDLGGALAELDSLLNAHPGDAYFHELKGQILFENGRVREAIPAYAKAASLSNGNSLISLELATAQLATEDSALLEEAITALERVVVEEPKNILAWHQLGIAYGRNGDLGASYLALAEKAALQQRKEDVAHFTSLAKEHIAKDAPDAVRLEDLRRLMQDKKKRRSKEEGV